MKYWYITWVDKGNGYYVSYKDKTSRRFSHTHLEANKYKTIRGAINNLNLYTSAFESSKFGTLLSMDDFWDLNPPTAKHLRNKKLNILLNGDDDLSLIFKQGRVDKLFEDGSIECVNIEVINYIEDIVKENQRKKKKFENKHRRYYNGLKYSVKHLMKISGVGFNI